MAGSTDRAVTTPQTLPPVDAVPGIRIGTAAAGIRKRGRDDLVLFELAPGSACAAVFTRNAFAAAPVTVARRHLAAGAPRALLVNSGNANAGTGERGVGDALATCELAAAALGCRPAQVLPFSTGVIGEPLPVERFRDALPAAAAALTATGWDAAARAIMTTDTVPKRASARFTAGGAEGVITGIAKGAGMIRPDMATMLAYVATDAAIPQDVLQAALGSAVDASFNCITIDGDTSTNDASVLVATGAGDARVAPGDAAGLAAFRAALEAVCVTLAQAIVRDGEGATKFVTLDVSGGRDAAECRQVAYTIAHSPLVKTALFASDPNWGRILAAVGRAGLTDLDIAGVTVDIGGIPIVRRGARVPDYVEAPVAAVLAGSEFTIAIGLGRGAAQARVWTCDLSHDYVRINAEYRT